MDSPLAAFFREAQSLSLDPAHKATVREAILGKLRLISTGSASEFALQTVAVACER
jgi:hypothetical protein